jgi:ergothioneine biosynthesis protein EgtB
MLRRVRDAALASIRAHLPEGPGQALAEQYCGIRFATEKLADPLSPEDLAVQSMPDASPTKWHLAHTSWFFEKAVVKEARPDHQEFNSSFDYLFNSYYECLGARQCRSRRGLSSRPTIEEIFDYRRFVDAHVLALLAGDEPIDPHLAERIAVGLHHEQQHQELILTDIKHALAINPVRPRYIEPSYDLSLLCPNRPLAPLTWRYYPTQLIYVGSEGGDFSFDNERPRHQALVHEFELGRRLVTCGEFAAFIADGGYRRPEFWLADGWAMVAKEGWQAPLYWEWDSDRWWQMTLAGMRPICDAEPVCHVSYFEADAYARWADARLPTEQEWETAATPLALEGNFVENGVLQPLALPENDDALARELPQQMFGDVWEWTASPHLPYPGFRPWKGMLGEYTAKFMCNQMVLRGGSCATPRSHVRVTYRNYFPPHARWQFSGFRLARSG